MGSSKLGEARPVRRPPSSCLSRWIAPCMRRLSSARSWVAVAMEASRYNRGGSARRRPALAAAEQVPRSPDDRRSSFAAEHRGDRTRIPDREHNDRHTGIAGKREGGGIEDFQVTIERLLVREPFETHRLRIFFRIG